MKQKAKRNKKPNWNNGGFVFWGNKIIKLTESQMAKIQHRNETKNK